MGLVHHKSSIVKYFNAEQVSKEKARRRKNRSGMNGTAALKRVSDDDQAKQVAKQVFACYPVFVQL